MLGPDGLHPQRKHVLCSFKNVFDSRSFVERVSLIEALANFLVPECQILFWKLYPLTSNTSMKGFSNLFPPRAPSSAADISSIRGMFE